MSKFKHKGNHPNNDTIVNVQKINLFVLIIINLATVGYTFSLFFTNYGDVQSRIITGIVAICFGIFSLSIYFIKILHNHLKYIYPLLTILIVMAVLYTQKGAIDNLFIFFPVMAAGTLYYKYEILIISTIFTVILNILGFIWNKPLLYPHIDLGQFISLLLSLGLTGGIIAYSIRKGQQIINKAQQEEVRAKEALKELEKTLVHLDKAYTQLKETQAQLIQQEKMASLGMLVAGVAHEINNPLGAINCNVGLFNNIISKLKTKDQIFLDNEIKDLIFKLEYINQTNSIACERILAIVKSLRNFARLDEAEYKKIDIHIGIDNTLVLLHNRLKNKIEVVKEYGNIPEIWCYPNQLNQVFMNILVNAIDAIPETGTIKITTYSDNQYVNIKIKDSGIGIPPENINKIFDPGFTTKGVGIGTGLGLAIVYKIIQNHKGRIFVNSEVNKGTEFHIQIPLITDIN